MDFSRGEIISSHELYFKVKDWDRFSSSNDLGYASIHAKQLLEVASINLSKPQETMLKIVQPKNRAKETDAGSMTIRLMSEAAINAATKLDRSIKGGK